MSINIFKYIKLISIHTYINIHLYSTKYTHHTIYKQYQKFVARKEM